MSRWCCVGARWARCLCWGLSQLVCAMAAADGGGFQVEYAKSGRASCRNTKCKGNIQKDELRVARMVRSPFFDGFQPNWFHLDCFFFKNAWGAKSPSELQGVTDLRPDDQKAVADGFTKLLASQGAAAAGGKGKGKGKKKGGGAAAAAAAAPDRSMELLAPDGSALLRVEHAKSSRAGCRYCEVKIDKDVLRIGVMMEPDENSESSFRGMRTWWHHRKCFGSVLEQKIHASIPLATLTPQHFEGHQSIDVKDVKDMGHMFDDARKKAGAPKLSVAKQGKKSKNDSAADDGPKTKKSKNDGSGASAAAAAAAFQDTALQAKLTAQASELWKIKDELALSSLSTTDLKAILSNNSQPARGGENTLRDLVADGMLFGALGNCAECGSAASFVLKSDGYHCQGDISAYAPCLVVTHNPARKPFKISKNYRSIAATDYFSSWKYSPRSRLFGEAPRARTDGQPAAAPVGVSANSAESAAAAAAAPNAAATAAAAAAAGKPLTRVKVAYAGKVGMAKLKRIVTALGGENVAALNSTVTCVITTEDEVEKGTARIVEANKFALPLVSDAWLREAEDKKNLPLLATHLIHCAGSVLEPAHESAPDRMLKRKRGGASQTVVARGGGAVDPASGLAEEGSTCAVLTEGSTVWSASLSLVDLRSGANSFYKLQVIVDTERANTKRATFFRAWGRLGTRQGDKRISEMGLAAAKAEFCEQFLAKTGNEWEDRAHFRKQPRMFDLVDVAYDGGDDEGSNLPDALKGAAVAGQPGASQLPKQVQALVSQLFDVSQAEATMSSLSYELDTRKMPLGKISAATIRSGYAILKEIEELLAEVEGADADGHVAGGGEEDTKVKVEQDSEDSDATEEEDEAVAISAAKAVQPASAAGAVTVKTEGEQEDMDDSDRVVWYWRGDSKKGAVQDIWVHFDATTCAAIEAARAAKEKQYKLDAERFLDFKKMAQARYDDPKRRRALKRETPAMRRATMKRKATMAAKKELKEAAAAAVAANNDEKEDLAVDQEPVAQKKTATAPGKKRKQRAAAAAAAAESSATATATAREPLVLSALPAKIRQGLLEASTRFYSKIPHSFGSLSPPILMSTEQLKAKTLLLDELLQLEQTAQIIRSANADEKDISGSSATAAAAATARVPRSPIDVCYDKLNCDMSVLAPDSSEYNLIQEMLLKTHGDTHKNFTLSVDTIFAVDRHGERERYRARSEDIASKALLWHGSRTSNFAGIIAQGLRIAPPEAPMTGYMFGKGVYFADMVSKSAQYCFATAANPTGLLLLCEVALGSPLELTGAKSIKKLPAGKDSTKGTGQTEPDPDGDQVIPSCLEGSTDDGAQPVNSSGASSAAAAATPRLPVRVPCGEGIRSDVRRTSLLYNEFIVYDVAQVKIRYIVKVDFEFSQRLRRR